jgi:AcrR family transcriptional regulator
MQEGLRARKKAATRLQLMTTALRLFAEQGFEQTTVEQIAAAADVAPRTFFRYFPTKLDVLFADHPEEIGFFTDALAARTPGEPVIDAVRRALLAGVAKAVSHPTRFVTRARLVSAVPAAHAHGRYLDSKFEDVIAQAVASDRGTDPSEDLQARLIARVAWGAVCAARDVWVASGGEHDPAALIDEAFDLLDHDLRASGLVAPTPTAQEDT